MSDQQPDRTLQTGDEVEIVERHKIIGIEGPDVLTLNLGDGEVHRWDCGLHDRDGVEVVRLD